MDPGLLRRTGVVRAVRKPVEMKGFLQVVAELLREGGGSGS